MLIAAVRRELFLLWRQPSAVLQPLAFLVLVVLLVGIALGPTPNRLTAVAPAILLLAVLLAQLLYAEGALSDEAREGVLDQWLTSPASLAALLYGKLLARVAALLLPLLVGLPLLAGMLAVDAEWPRLASVLTLLTLGAATLALLGAALTVRLARGGMLLALMVLPWNLPLLLFALGALDPEPEVARAAWLLLAAQTVATVTLGPPAAALALRAGSE